MSYDNYDHYKCERIHLDDATDWEITQGFARVELSEEQALTVLGTLIEMLKKEFNREFKLVEVD